jgi:hypothetical protein
MSNEEVPRECRLILDSTVPPLRPLEAKSINLARIGNDSDILKNEASKMFRGNGIVELRTRR